MKMTKVKKWIKEHEDEVIIGGWLTAFGLLTAGTFYCIGKQCCLNDLGIPFAPKSRIRNAKVAIRQVELGSKFGESSKAALKYDWDGLGAVRDFGEIGKAMTDELPGEFNLDNEVTGVILMINPNKTFEK